MNSLGIYEKALPKGKTWKETFEIVRDLGFNFIEISIDESDERLARLDWSREEREEVREASWQTGVRIHTLMLSGHRRFPLGSKNPETREKSIEMLKKCVDLAVDLGVRNIQMAGYDVYYEEKTVSSREYFMENLKTCVEYAAMKQVMLDIESMDDPFMNSLDKITELKTQIKSPWLQSYPDVGNLSAWLGNETTLDLERHIDSIVSVHLKDTYAVTKDKDGQFRDVPFGEGCVDFEGCLRALKRLGYTGAFTIEMWSENADDPIKEVKEAKAFFDHLFEKVGIEQEPIKNS